MYVYISVFNMFVSFVHRIWSHLTEMASSNNTTIVLTTHYIEEARQAHLVTARDDSNYENIDILM